MEGVTRVLYRKMIFLVLMAEDAKPNQIVQKETLHSRLSQVTEDIIMANMGGKKQE